MLHDVFPMFKVDFEKAHDLADLEFLLMVMEEMDFQKKRWREYMWMGFGLRNQIG